jgi:drug/metabolite transporter (DMT)-like permease
MKENQKKGALLSTLAILSWGLLPVSAKGLIEILDAATLNFYRFLVAIIPLALYLLIKNKRAFYSRLHKKSIALLVIAVAGLLLNHIYFMVALKDISAGTSQVIMQIGPLLLLVLLFFNERLVEIFDLKNTYGRGVLIMTFAAVVWIFYGLAQKLLVSMMSPMIVMLCCYIGGVLILYPLADKSAFLSLGIAQMVLLLICTFSSLVAYVAFAESMNYWQASKSSAFLAVIPLVSIGFEMIFALLFPAYIDVHTISLLSLVGAVIVVAGTMTITLCGEVKVNSELS